LPEYVVEPVACRIGKLLQRHIIHHTDLRFEVGTQEAKVLFSKFKDEVSVVGCFHEGFTCRQNDRASFLGLTAPLVLGLPIDSQQDETHFIRRGGHAQGVSDMQSKSP
jgi:hypothetical protein